MKDTTTPIKRSQALIQFSWEHHFGLLLVWKTWQGLKENIEPNRISDYAIFIFENKLSEHFEQEEKEIENLYLKLIENEEAKKYFEAETKFNIIIADVNKIIGDAIKDVIK